MFIFLIELHITFARYLPANEIPLFFNSFQCKAIEEKLENYNQPPIEYIDKFQLEKVMIGCNSSSQDRRTCKIDSHPQRRRQPSIQPQPKNIKQQKRKRAKQKAVNSLKHRDSKNFLS